jgi:hypothetical protein
MSDGTPTERLGSALADRYCIELSVFEELRQRLGGGGGR